jgi:hypothetical protein
MKPLELASPIILLPSALLAGLPQKWRQKPDWALRQRAAIATHPPSDMNKRRPRSRRLPKNLFWG